MRTWIIDANEFRNPPSEERLEISRADRAEFTFPSIELFAATTIGTETYQHVGESRPFDQIPDSATIREYLWIFANIELPKPCDWPSFTPNLGPDERHLLISGPELFIRYSWTRPR